MQKDDEFSEVSDESFESNTDLSECDSSESSESNKSCESFGKSNDLRESCDCGDSCESTDSRESLALFAFSFWIAKCLAIWILDLQILLHTFHSFVIIAVAPKCASLLIKLRGFFVIFFHAFALFVHNA